MDLSDIFGSKEISELFDGAGKAAKGAAKGVAKTVESTAKGAAKSVEGAARGAANSLGNTLQSIVINSSIIKYV